MPVVVLLLLCLPPHNPIISVRCGHDLKRLADVPDCGIGIGATTTTFRDDSLRPNVIIPHLSFLLFFSGSSIPLLSSRQFVSQSTLTNCSTCCSSISVHFLAGSPSPSDGWGQMCAAIPWISFFFFTQPIQKHSCWHKSLVRSLSPHLPGISSVHLIGLPRTYLSIRKRACTACYRHLFLSPPMTFCPRAFGGSFVLNGRVWTDLLLSRYFVYSTAII